METQPLKRKAIPRFVKPVVVFRNRPRAEKMSSAAIPVVPWSLAMMRPLVELECLVQICERISRWAISLFFPVASRRIALAELGSYPRREPTHGSGIAVSDTLAINPIKVPVICCLMVAPRVFPNIWGRFVRGYIYRRPLSSTPVGPGESLSLNSKPTPGVGVAAIHLPQRPKP